MSDKIVEIGKAKQVKEKNSIIKVYMAELKKVVWPTSGATWKNTAITLIMIFVVGVFVFLFDMFIRWLFGLVMMIAH